MSDSAAYNTEIRAALDDLADGIQSRDPEAVWTAHHLHFTLAMSEYDQAHLLEADRLYNIAEGLDHSELKERRWSDLKAACEKRIARNISRKR
jgi:hypothetical protein